MDDVSAPVQAALIGPLSLSWSPFDQRAPLIIGGTRVWGVAVKQPGCVRVRWRWKSSARHHLDGGPYL